MALAGTLEIQMRAELTKLAADLQNAKRLTGDSMSAMEASMAQVQKAIDEMSAAEKARAGVFARTWGETKRLLSIAKDSAKETSAALEKLKIDPAALRVPPDAIASWKTWQEASAAAIGAGAAAGWDKAKTAWEEFKAWTERQLVILGVAFAVGISAVVVGAVYAAVKSANFAVGLLTGESYKSANIDALQAMNEEVKTLQSALPLTASGASALNEALKMQGVSAAGYASTINSVSSATRSNGAELDRLGVKYKAQNGALLTTEQTLASAAAVLATYTEGWDRNQAATAIGMGSEKQIQTALALTAEKVAVAKDRLDDYTLAIGPGTQAAVARYEEAMRAFNRESDLTSQGFKRAIADNIMPVLTDLAEFFRDGFPTVVRVFRYTMAEITSLFYGLKTVIYLVAESILGSIEALGVGIGALGVAAFRALQGDFTGAGKALVQGWTDAKARLGLIGDNIVAQAQRNAAAMKQAWGFDEAQSAAKAKTGNRWVPAPTVQELKAVEDGTKALAALIQSMKEKDAAALAELATGKKLTDSEKERVMLESKIAELARKYPALAMDEANALAAKTVEDIKSVEAHRQMLEAIDAANKAIAERAQKLGDDIAAAERALEIYGLTKSQIEAMTIARLEENLAIERARDADEATLAYYEKEIDARKRIRAAMAGVEAKDTAKKAAEDATKAWTDFTRDLESSLTNALMRSFESGESFGEAFAKNLQNLFKTMILKAAVQLAVGTVASAAQSATGISFGGSSGGGTIGGAMSLLSTGQSLYGAITGGTASALGGMIGGSFGAGMQGASLAAGLAGPTTAGAAGAMGAGAMVASAIPWAAGALAVGSMLGLFDGGGDDPHNNPQVSGFHFGLGRGGATGGAGLGTPSSFVAGPTSGSGWWGENTALSAAQISALNQQTAVAFEQGYAMARLLGVDPSVIDSASVTSTVNGSPGNGGIAGYFASIDQAFAALGDAITQKIIPDLASFQQTGETLAQTGSRLTQEFTLLNQAAAMMGKDITGLTLKARDQLITMLGGVSGATSAIGGYYQAFHSERERTADTRSGISATLRAIGISNTPTTREQFRAMVEAQDLMTESGRTMYATLISVSDAFAGITKSAEDMAAALSTDLFKTRQDYLYAQITGIMPSYASGGDHPGGWAMVGENGPELRNMGPSRIYSNSDSKSLLDTSGLQAEMAALRSDVRTIGATLANTAKRTTKTIERWDADGLPAARTLV